MRLKTDLQQAILAWDGKTRGDLEALYEQTRERKQFTETLIALLLNPKCEKGASWLLKAHCDKGHELSTSQASSILAQLDTLQMWESKLHVLQCLEHFNIEKHYKKTLETFLRHALKDRNAFLRTWAYHGFHVLARQYPQYREEVEQLFRLALRDESAAVKARIRKLTKRGF